LALTQAGAAGFGGWRTWALLAAGGAALAGFVLVERRSPHAMTPPALFASRPFVGANLLTLGLYFAIGGALFFLPFELIRVRGWSAAAAGAALLPFSLVMGAFSGLAGRIADRFGARLPLVVGPPIAGMGLALMGFAAGGAGYWTGLLPATVVMAVGMTIAVAPLTSTVMGAVGADHAGTASGVNNAVARIARLLAVAALSLVFSRVFDHAMAGISGAPSPGSALAVDPHAAAPALRTAEQAALDRAFRVVSLVSAVCAALAAVPAALWISSRPTRADSR
jgi:hypothetical protein